MLERIHKGPIFEDVRDPLIVRMMRSDKSLAFNANLFPRSWRAKIPAALIDA
jgi:hypothetical protein